MISVVANVEISKHFTCVLENKVPKEKQSFLSDQRMGKNDNWFNWFKKSCHNLKECCYRNKINTEESTSNKKLIFLIEIE